MLWGLQRHVHAPRQDHRRGGGRLATKCILKRCMNPDTPPQKKKSAGSVLQFLHLKPVAEIEQFASWVTLECTIVRPEHIRTPQPREKLKRARPSRVWHVSNCLQGRGWILDDSTVLSLGLPLKTVQESPLAHQVPARLRWDLSVGLCQALGSVAPGWQQRWTTDAYRGPGAPQSCVESSQSSVFCRSSTTDADTNLI